MIKCARKKPSASCHELALKARTSKSTAQRILMRHGLNSYSVQNKSNRNDQQALRAKLRARKLYDQYLRGQDRCVVMDDKTYVVDDFK